jgi:hypothetical protein
MWCVCVCVCVYYYYTITEGSVCVYTTHTYMTYIHTCIHVCMYHVCRGTHQYLVKIGDLDGSSDRTK